MTPPVALGIDLGTSALKLLLIDAAGDALAVADRQIAVHSPFPGAAELDPADWWSALDGGMQELAATAPKAMSALSVIGLSGQMHGLVCLDAQDRVLRPAILWNDNRAVAEARAAAAVPGLEATAGLRPAPGLTACKLAWIDKHEGSVREKLARITFCKDYLRLRMTGVHATDPCEAAGSLLFDEAARDWSSAALDRFGLSRGMLPQVCEGPEPTGVLSGDLALRWGIAAPPAVVAGAGDGAAGAIGLGSVAPGSGYISIGTSAQISIAQSHYTAAPGSTLQVLAHGLPGMWYRAAALQSGAGAIAWAARLTGLSVPDLLARVETVDPSVRNPVFLPYLAGERTPHDNPDARAVLFGMLADHGPAEIGRAVLRGLTFALADGYDALARLGEMPKRLAIVGGGARSALLCRMVASVLDRPLDLTTDSQVGAALGVARLALSHALGCPVSDVAPPGKSREIAPDPVLGHQLRADLAQYRSLYRALESQFVQFERAEDVS